jgi:hypothetical protein
MPDLTKWPLLLVKGERVTEQQANEILIRTCVPSYLSANDQDWNQTVARIMGLPEGDDWPPKEIAQDDAARMAWHHERWERRDRRTAELGILGLNYLYNSRIASSWIGGPHGWCDWDGSIGCNTHNIGKWPSEEDVTEEWTVIAEAFPYLDLTAQLVTNEGEGELAAEWRVQGGTVEQREPGKQIRLMAEPSLAGFFMGGRERGVSPERLEVAVAQVLDARAA